MPLQFLLIFILFSVKFKDYFDQNETNLLFILSPFLYPLFCTRGLQYISQILMLLGAVDFLMIYL